MRHLAIDLGDKRTGLAVGDTITRLVTPLEVLEIPVDRAGGLELLRGIGKAINDHGPAALVVGLPLNMDGTEGPRAKKVRSFAERIAAATKLPLHYQDERLSSVQADWQMARSGMTHGQKKGRRDALAAASILNDYLSRVSPETTSDVTDEPRKE